MPQDLPEYYVVVNGSNGTDTAAENTGSVSGKIEFEITRVTD